jgi:spore maturation protein CgeB
MIKLTRENWQEQLEKTKPDLLLVESCWRGNDGNWGTLTKGSGGGKKLGGVLRYCKEQGIPTVFWNKEDPPHYDKFGAVAALFGVAITTDINMVPNYKKDFGITAHALSFAAQPKIHNPSLGVVRLDKAVFAGSYYSERKDRCKDFHDIVSDLEAVGVGYDIYDRNHMSGIERFQYPDRYAANIIGKLPPEELWKVNNGYKYQINLNSVTDSSTMFARRVYESLASGTPVISNASKGVNELFGDLMQTEASLTKLESWKIAERNTTVLLKQVYVGLCVSTHIVIE